MARRPLGEPLYEINERRGGRLLIAMLVVLALAVAVMSGVVQLGPVSMFSNRQARKLLSDAESWEAESLYRTAAEQYETVCDNPKIRNDLRLEAAQHLAALERNYLHDPAAEEKALEKAYRFAQGRQREQVRAQLEALRGSPLRQTAASAAVNSTQPVASDENATTTPPAADEVAQVGRQRVTIDDILFAWTRLNGEKAPTAGDLQTFVPQYLDMVLMADEAERRGMDKAGRTARDLKLNRLMTLNTAFSAAIVEALDTPSETELEKFYQAHADFFAGPAVLTLAPFVVRDAEHARDAAAALADGDEFAGVARHFGVSLADLKPGAAVKVNGADPSIRALNDDSGLPARLARMREGTTTGPLQTARGPAFFKLLEKTGGIPPPFQAVHEQVLLAYQRQALAQKRQTLLRELKQSRQITIDKAGWEHLIGADAQPAVRPGVAPAAASEASSSSVTTSR